MSNNIPKLNIKLNELKEETHPTYGVSYKMTNNVVEIEGQLFKLNTFKQYEERELVGGGKTKVVTNHMSFRPIEASKPKEVSEADKLRMEIEELRRENAKLAKAKSKREFDSGTRVVAKPA